MRAGEWTEFYRSWGGTQTARHRVMRPGDAAAATRGVATAGDMTMLGYGCGRSYGDVALNPDGALVDCRGLDRFVAFDRTDGVLVCEAGVRLADILAVLCKPEADGAGWMLPVTPGTRFVTVAGAIANDVHGKNHHALGSFGRHVQSFDLLRGDGRVLTCSITENADLFAATIGGLGLTGLILRATLRLRRVAGLAVEAEDIRFESLADFFELTATDPDWEYTAAWIDCLATGAARGRGIFSRARHAAGRGAPPPSRAPRISIPVRPPFALTSPLTVGAFNALYWRKLGRPARRRRLGTYEPIFYPLDAIGGWNRLYGPRGFFQFQSVVPMAGARDAIDAMLREIAASKQGSMLSVLKLLGGVPSPGLLSFPMAGASLALDFPNRGETTRRLLARLEAITVEAGGRIYPAKDSLMTQASFETGYPRHADFRRFIDPRFSSAFARRVGLVAASR